MSESPRNRGQYGVCSPFASVNPGMAKPAGSCPCNSGSERETQPPEQATEARPVELVLSQPTRSEANPAHPEVGALDISAEAKRGAEGFLNSTAEVSASSSGSLSRQELMSPGYFRITV